MDNGSKQNTHAQDVQNSIDESAVSLSCWLGCVDRFNATAKQRLFGNILGIVDLVKKIPDNVLKEQINRRLEGALSCESRIINSDRNVTEKHNR